MKMVEHYDKEFELGYPDLQNGEAKFVIGEKTKRQYLVTREGNLFRIYVLKG